MRIQQTDRILKESRYGRHHPMPDDRGLLRRMWSAITHLFQR